MKVHWMYTLIFIALVISGILLYFPEIRHYITGGYSLVISKIHKYIGIAAIPMLGVFWVNLWNSQSKMKRWQIAHTRIVLVSGVLFIISGINIWFVRGLTDTIYDMSVTVHQVLTFIVMAVLIAHLIMIRLEEW